jgi:hypothetical protein
MMRFLEDFLVMNCGTHFLWLLPTVALLCSKKDIYSHILDNDKQAVPEVE